MAKSAAALLLLCLPPLGAAAQTCAFRGEAGVVVDDGKRLLRWWEEKDSPVWDSGLLPDAPAYWEFVRAVSSRMDVSAEERYLAAPEPSKGEPPDDYNARMMLKEGVGRLHPVSCLEALLLDAQASRRPMAAQPTEFLAFVLRRGDRLKIWSYTVDQPGIGRLGPLKEYADRDVADGWWPYMNVHNHDFFFDKSPAVPGKPWPSAVDVQLLRGLEVGGRPFTFSAVTNGLLTSRLAPDALKKLRAVGE